MVWCTCNLSIKLHLMTSVSQLDLTQLGELYHYRTLSASVVVLQFRSASQLSDNKLILGLQDVGAPNEGVWQEMGARLISPKNRKEAGGWPHKSEFENPSAVVVCGCITEADHGY